MILGTPPVGRRRTLALAAAAGACAGLGWLGARPAAAALSNPGSAAFTVEWLRDWAKQLAAQPYEPPAQELPAALTDLDYDHYREIRFRQDRALWRDLDLTFEAQFFHPGFYHRDAVEIAEVVDSVARPIGYSPELFDFGKSGVDPAALPPDIGFAGFRLHYPLNRADYMDEVAVFLGASYFRCVGQGNGYGISARGLALNTGLQEGEEFPVFRKFWLERPGPGATEVKIHALLDSPSAAGAYSFALRPGQPTVVQVDSFLAARNAIKLIGIAPLTSMYFFGENDHSGADDYRPEVHDSDGLSIWHGSGEWLWRPLSNPEQLAVTAFEDTSPRGFGLLQRDRDHRSYEDLEAFPEKRPTLWVEPLASWGPGEIQLLEIPSDDEIHDNIVAFWVPQTPIGAGASLQMRYQLHWGNEPPFAPPGGRVRATRIGAVKDNENARRFVLDFGGGQLAQLDPATPLEAVVTASTGQLGQTVVHANAEVEGWRAFFDFVPDGSNVADLRCFLRHGDQVLSETWSYRWMG
ncbi:MAG TPA: glucan biosynthesis protein G [Dongiaceae bacterium]